MMDRRWQRSWCTTFAGGGGGVVGGRPGDEDIKANREDDGNGGTTENGATSLRKGRGVWQKLMEHKFKLAHRRFGLQRFRVKIKRLFYLFICTYWETNFNEWTPLKLTLLPVYIHDTVWNGVLFSVVRQKFSFIKNRNTAKYTFGYYHFF